MKEASRLTYTAPDGKVYKGFVNIIHAQRRGLVSSEILDSTKYARVFADIRLAYIQAKRLAENNLDEPMRSAIREREYERMMSERNQEAGLIDELPLVPTR